MRSLKMAILAALLALPAHADANAITLTFNVERGDLLLNFTVTFDPELELYGPRAQGLKINSINFNLDSGLEFGWQKQFDALAIGTDLQFRDSINQFVYVVPFSGNKVDFFIRGVTTDHPRVTDFAYSQDGVSPTDTVQEVTLTVTREIAIPEPAGILMLGIGLAALGLMRKRREPSAARAD